MLLFFTFFFFYGGVMQHHWRSFETVWILLRFCSGFGVLDSRLYIYARNQLRESVYMKMKYKETMIAEKQHEDICELPLDRVLEYCQGTKWNVHLGLGVKNVWEQHKDLNGQDPEDRWCKTASHLGVNLDHTAWVCEWIQSIHEAWCDTLWEQLTILVNQGGFHCINEHKLCANSCVQK